jgi:hypothetical protein
MKGFAKATAISAVSTHQFLLKVIWKALLKRVSGVPKKSKVI